MDLSIAVCSMTRRGLNSLAVFPLLLLATGVSLSSAQVSDECPENWYEHTTRCYKFVVEPTPVQRARIECQQDWATLVSVDTPAQHAFIQQKLEAKTLAGQEWFTSGYRAKDGTFRWASDGSVISTDYFPSEGVRKQRQEDPGLNIPYNRIVYTYHEGDSNHSFVWGWGRIMTPGGYICQIDKSDTWKIYQQRRDFSYGTGITEPHLWKMGPNITYQSPNTLFFRTEMGTTPVVLDCQASGNPSPVYKWFRQKLGQTTRQAVTSALGPDYVVTNGRLTILKPTDTRDSSIYTCEATNIVGTVQSNPIEVSYGILDEFSPNPVSFTPAKLYQGVEVTCQSISANTELAYNWNRGSVRTFIRPSLNPQYFLSKNGRLYISEVRAEDQGEYRCMVDMVARQGQVLAVDQAPSRTSKPIKLVVYGNNANTYGPDIQDKFPQFFPTEPMVGERVEIECLAYGRLPLRYAWRRDDGPMNPNVQYLDHNRRLVIPKARLEDTGAYTCIVRSATNTATKQAFLSLKARPSFPYPLHNQFLDKGSDFTWTCTAIGVPIPTYTWFKNGVKLQDDADMGIAVQGNTLTIAAVDTKHEGMYQCEARNINGMARSSAQLKSLSVAPTFSITPVVSSKTAAQGGDVRIACKPQAAPRAEIRWERNGAEISTVLPNGDLHLTDLKVTDSGKYTCVATSPLGEDRSSCVLTVQAMSIFTEEPEDKTINIRESTTLPCRASFDRSKTDVVYTWSFFDHVIDFAGQYSSDRLHYDMPNAVNREDGMLFITGATYELEGLYTCKVSSVTGSISTSAYLTVNGPPGEPGGVHARGSNRDKGFQQNVELWWQKGRKHGYDVSHYVIEYRSISDPKDEWTVLIDDLPDSETYLETYPDWRGYWIKGQLSPGTSYNFRVTACSNDIGCSPPSFGPYTYYRVDSAPPIFAPDNVGGGGGAIGLLQMKWDPLPRSKWGGDRITYILYYRKQTSSNDSQWETMKTDDTFYNTVVGAANYYLPYDVKVQAKNERGTGPNSTISTVYSAEILPTLQPKFLEANGINATAGIVVWEGVPNTRESAHGQIGGTQINYWEGGDTLCEDTLEYTAQSLNVYGDATEGLLIGMNPGGDYCVNLQLYNAAGLGPKTDNYYLGVNDAPPSQYPEYVIVMSQGEDSVRLLWDGVTNGFGEEPIGGYKAWWWKITENIRNATETDFGKSFTGVLHGVEKDLIYRLRMMAYSAGGDGAKGPEVFFTLGGLVQYDPLTMEIMNSSPPSFFVTSHPVHVVFTIVITLWVQCFV